MKVLLTAHRFWPHVGGTEEVVERLAQQHVEAGHDVTVATMQEDGTPLEETRDGYQIRRFAMRRVGGFRVPPLWAYARFVMSKRWDIVHLHGQRIWSTDYLYPVMARIRAPVVFTAHGFYQWHMEARPVLDETYYKRVLPSALRHVDAIIALTSLERDELVSWGVSPDKIRVIPDGFHSDEDVATGADGARFRADHDIAPDRPLLLYVGGFYTNKRVDRLVRAAAHAGATLVVVGRDAHVKHGRAECEALATELGADVRFVGRIARRDVLAAYAAADVFVLGSDFEGFGLVLLEAMRAGLPFVAMRAGAAPDLAETGAGIACADEPAFFGAIKALLGDPARRATMAQHGRAGLAPFTWQAVARRHHALYEEIARQ